MHLPLSLILCVFNFYSQKQNAVHSEVEGRSFWLYLAGTIICVLGAGICSGLNIGLLSIDVLNLNILKQSGTPLEKKRVSRILPLAANHHLLLCTLLCWNSIFGELIPIFSEPLMGYIGAILFSVTALLIFGEILPQALFSRYALAIGWFFAPIVWILIALTFIICYPLSLLLDLCLGTTHTVYKRAQLGALIAQHKQKPDRRRSVISVGSPSSNQSSSSDSESSTLSQGELREDEAAVMQGALVMAERTAAHVLTPIREVLMFPIEASIGPSELDSLRKMGYSRIPVYQNHDRSDIVGVLRVKQLVGKLYGDRSIPVSELKLEPLEKIPHLFTTTPLYSALEQFQKNCSHLAIVEEPRFNVLVGILTLEDVLEVLLGIDISEIVESTLNDGKRLCERRRARQQATATQLPHVPPKGSVPPQSQTNTYDEGTLPKGEKRASRKSGRRRDRTVKARSHSLNEQNIDENTPFQESSDVLI